MTAPDPPRRREARTRPPGSQLLSGAGGLLGVLGGVTIAVSSWLHWLGGPHTRNESGFKVPAKFLLDSHAKEHGYTLGVVVLTVGLIAVVAAFHDRGRLVELVCGVIALIVVGLFVFQLRLALHDLNRGFGTHLQITDAIGLGPFVAAGGGIIAAVGASLPRPSPRQPGPHFEDS